MLWTSTIATTNSNEDHPRGRARECQHPVLPHAESLQLACCEYLRTWLLFEVFRRRHGCVVKVKTTDLLEALPANHFLKGHLTAIVLDFVVGAVVGSERHPGHVVFVPVLEDEIHVAVVVTFSLPTNF